MTFFGILGTIFIGPLKLVFEIVFSLANFFLGHPGLAIIALSLVMNFLVLPLYRRADAMQEEARDVENRLKPGVDHIKKTFTGDERMMMLQTYYRQNNYSPTDALNGSASLLLEVPFFIAAYQFLSHVACLQGVSLGPIADLGAPDAMLCIGGVAINVLPILMTLINVVSSAVYSKGFPLKTKIQLYGVALIFLVFLYESPAGLVFYWTLNNIFSLVKNIFYKLKNPRLVLYVMAFAAGLAALGFALFIYDRPSVRIKSYIMVLGLVLMLPLIWSFVSKRVRLPKLGEAEPDKKLFLLGSVFLTVLVGILIPSTFIAASPQEYVDVTYFHNPLNYLVMSAAMSIGFFMVWMRVFYWLSGARAKCFFDKLVWVLAILALVNYMFFGTELGVISAELKYENTELSFRAGEALINLALMALGALLLSLAAVKWRKLPARLLALACAALVCMSAINAYNIKRSVDRVVAGEGAGSEELSIPLSRSGKNVVVIMLDRAMGQVVPYLVNEKPELKEQFDGFTYYSNVISHGGHTNFGTPGLFGGYEYTPVEINKRADEALVDKHNEALLVMPRIFLDEGYDVTVFDPVYANYQWIPDLSIYDEYPGINAAIAQGRFVDDEQKQGIIDNNYRNFFCFSLMKCLPVILQDTVYSGGNYNQVDTVGKIQLSQVQMGRSMAMGYTTSFMNNYTLLENLPAISHVSDSGKNSFTVMVNDITHQPILLSEPEYIPAAQVDNREFDAANEARFMLDGVEFETQGQVQMAHYHVNMAALIQLGNWFDYLRDEGVYDNTRIILVADHGYADKTVEKLIMGEKGDNIAKYFPLLMVKDFDSHGFEQSHEFMTNADVPTLATENLVENAVNPFTGKPINSDEKTAHEQYVSLSLDWKVYENNAGTFSASRWASVSEDIWDEDNWTFYNEEVVIPEPALK